MANEAHRYESSELFVFSHFQLDIFVAGFLLQAVLRVRLEYLVKLSTVVAHKETIKTKAMIFLLK